MCNIPIPLEKDSQSERLNQRRPVAAWQSHRGRTLETGRRIHTRERCWMQKAHRLRIYTLSLSLCRSRSRKLVNTHDAAREGRDSLSLTPSLSCFLISGRATMGSRNKRQKAGYLFRSIVSTVRARGSSLSSRVFYVWEYVCVYIYTLVARWTRISRMLGRHKH